ncbi:hypothetical protein M2246_003682 [Bacillus sp. LEw-kw-24]|nr:hypothetical protein bcere0017_58530 [Bacillus cereus Rock1-3]MDF9888479.1 hypothetical protein [Bacillus sp. LEw-kw-24]MDH6560727.1 hypothetical protein [Bacillus sp. LEw-kw-2]
MKEAGGEFIHQLLFLSGNIVLVLSIEKSFYLKDISKD